MNDADNDIVEDKNKVLEQDDHMRDMERLEMEVVSIGRPVPEVARVTGRIAPRAPDLWAQVNTAVRLEVETTGDARPTTRIYTIRRFDPERSEVEIDFVLHEDDSPAMRWLRGAAPGTRIWMTGPRGHFVPDFDSGKSVAIFADDTAIPAVFAILSAWPEGQRGAVWIETASPASVDALPRPEGVRLHVLPLPDAALVGTTCRLFDQARNHVTDAAGWTVWAAGERAEMREFRRHFSGMGIPRAHLQVLGYWKRGTSSSELDRIRLATYEAILARGLTMDSLDDSELPV